MSCRLSNRSQDRISLDKRNLLLNLFVNKLGKAVINLVTKYKKLFLLKSLKVKKQKNSFDLREYRLVFKNIVFLVLFE